MLEDEDGIVYEICEECDGVGWCEIEEDGEVETCFICDGEGWMEAY